MAVSISSSSDSTERTCSFVIGDDGLARWSDVHRDAWIGLLETHKRLTRALDAELDSRHDLSLSALEVLGRLAAADGRCLRLSQLAVESGLSLSRISRIVDALERRELVRRQPCAADARAVEALLTDAGLALARSAQATHFASVNERFFAQLSPTELTTLSTVFARFAPRAAEACTADEPGR
ncbi:MAG TPA: MarR family transcriptional regulator [Solirubrobacteraceae bacterium]|jgi:DNA-binding MarR family transcriptional regulator|nr:MarR family transcriptional regulator [Solirubrobacteraceae bacterium]